MRWPCWSSAPGRTWTRSRGLPHARFTPGEPAVSRHDRWVDREAGPVVRPYALTGGRTDPAGGTVLDLITVISAADPAPAPAGRGGLGPEHRALLRMCRVPVTVADVA